MSNYKPKGYWNKEKCHEEALKYSSRMEFSKKSGGAYNAAVRGNFIDEICEHIERRPPDYWNKQRCTEEALKYKTKTDFKKNSTSAFQSARRQKLLDEICRHMGLDYFERPRMIYSYEFLDNSVYIGLTYDPKARKSRHFCKNTSNRKSIVYKHLIDECSSYEYKELTGFLSEKEAQDKERYYIEIYRSLVPYGYNIQKGGEEPPHYRFEDNNNAKLKNNEAFAIQQELINWNIRRSQIKKKYKLTEDMLRHIIDGSSWFREDLIYPLRPKEKELDELRAKKVIDLLSTTSLTQKEIGQIVGWNRSAVTMINIGKNHHQEL